MLCYANYEKAQDNIKEAEDAYPSISCFGHGIPIDEFYHGILHITVPDFGRDCDALMGNAFATVIEKGSVIAALYFGADCVPSGISLEPTHVWDGHEPHRRFQPNAHKCASVLYRQNGGCQYGIRCQPQDESIGRLDQLVPHEDRFGISLCIYPDGDMVLVQRYAALQISKSSDRLRHRRQWLGVWAVAPDDFPSGRHRGPVPILPDLQNMYSYAKA